MSFTPCPDPTLGDASSVDAIETIVVPRAVDLGGMEVRRALPTLERQMVGPFIFWDQMGPAEFLTNEGMDVRPHPHINLATLTYLLEGEIHHRDSLGTSMAITPGAVNWMSAGSGIVHSERSSEDKRTAPQRLFGLQSWVALPRAVEEGAPSFQHQPADAIPQGDAEGVSLRVIAGSTHGLKSPLLTASETFFGDLTLAPGAAFALEKTLEERALYVVEGAVEIDGQTYETSRLIVFARGAEIVIRAPQGARAILFGGEPMEGPRYIWWNFVSSRRERVEQAKAEWRAGRFDTVPGDEEEFIPLPDTPHSPRELTPGS